MNHLFKEETKIRLKKLQQIIINARADAGIITSSVNQYWLCGFIFDGYMYVLPEGDPVLFVRRPSDIGDERVKQIRKPEQIPGLLHEAGLPQPKHILLESDVLAYSSATRLQTALGMPEVGNVSGEIRKIRAVKSEYELDQMRECADIHAKVYGQIPALYRAGMTDLELQIEIERQMRLHGSAGIFRSFGENMDIFYGKHISRR